ncbi:MAG: thioredoxin [Oscillospiraceae bacterium]|nr:thioredoxin [Oscillospiraceae bacterium]
MRGRSRFFLPAGIFLIGVISAAAGVWRGELSDIMQKAVVVCLECIGIG